MSDIETGLAGSTVGAAAAKVAFALASVGFIGTGLAAVVVMCMCHPRSKQEFLVCVICTGMGAICGGAGLIQYLELSHMSNSVIGLAAMLGMSFSCGLPSWAVVRWVFNYINAREGKDIMQVVQEIKSHKDNLQS